ncbi:MAG: right-handed parallel beta-helix repeat-containing protein, partial [Armatimonadota bacterium]
MSQPSALTAVLLGLLALGSATGWAQAPQPRSGAIIYVATTGNDAWSGKLATPNKSNTDGPFASLTRARDEARKLKATGPVTVQLRAGTYRLT